MAVFEELFHQDNHYICFNFIATLFRIFPKSREMSLSLKTCFPRLLSTVVDQQLVWVFIDFSWLQVVRCALKTRMAGSVYKIINGGLCLSHVHEKVCLIGQLMAFQGPEKRLLKIKTTDDMIILAEMTSSQEMQEGNNLWIEGKLSSKNKIVVENISVFSQGFDSRVYNEIASQIIEHGSSLLEVNEIIDHWGTKDPGIEGANVQLLNIHSGDTALVNSRVKTENADGKVSNVGSASIPKAVQSDEFGNDSFGEF